MKNLAVSKLTVIAACLVGLSGCIETTEVSMPNPAQRPESVPANSLEGQARTACIAEVRATTGNPDVSVIRSSFSEAGTEVILRVGPEGTWRCIGYRDGTTAGVMSTTNEGTL